MKQASLAYALNNMAAHFDQMLAALSTLQDLSQIRPEVIDQDQWLKPALETLIDHFGVAFGSIFLDEQGELTEAASCAWSELMPHAAKIDLAVQKPVLDQEQLKRIMESGQIENTTTQEVESSQEFSLLCTPILSGQEKLGVIVLSHPQANFFNEWHIRLLPLFSSFVGQLITTHRLLNNMNEQVKARTQELENLLEETTELKTHYKKLSLVDELTELYNRRFFFLEGKNILNRAIRYHHPFSLMLLDLDRFKSINDRYGHKVGDQVLQGISKKLNQMLRDTDLLARVGGEEFAIILPETDEEGAKLLAGRLLETIAEVPFTANGESFSMTASLGLVSLKEEELDSKKRREAEYIIDLLFTQADFAMYSAKHQGGNRLNVAKPDLP